MYATDRSLSAPSPFRFLPPQPFTTLGVMASTPVSSIASSATNVADVLASLGNDELAAEVGSWSAELQAKVVAAVSALSSTPTPTSASTAVRRRKGSKLDAASFSTAASWLAPAVAPADLTAELAAIQEGDHSPAATTIADEEVINVGAMQTPLGNLPVVVVDFSGATGPDLGGPGDGSADTGGLGGAARLARPRRLLPLLRPTAFLAAAGGDGGTTSAPTTTPPTPMPAKVGFLAAHGGDGGPTTAPATSTAAQPKPTALPPHPSAQPKPKAPPPPFRARHPAELRLPGPEPHETGAAQRSSLAELQRQIAAEMSDAAQETGNWGRAGGDGGVGSFPSPEEARAKTAHRHDRHGPLLLTGPAAAAGCIIFFVDTDLGPCDYGAADPSAAPGR